ncbi:MAG TPA: alpha/beta fold hydrolase [Bacteroidales bacterium]|nr:alpha/beta fold hydrolase [Bacteroidales bacterium]
MDSEGNGPVLFLVHGFLESSTMWEDLIIKLQQDYRCIAIDLPGHGRTSTFASTHSMAFMAMLTNLVMERESIPEATFIGHSMGGYVALQYLRTYNRKLSGLILLHSHASGDDAATLKNRQRAIEIIKHDRREFLYSFIDGLFAPENLKRLDQRINELRVNAEKMQPDAIIAAIKGMRERRDSMDLLESTDIPVIFIGGDRDSRIPVEKIIQQSSLSPNIAVQILANTGHMGHLEAADDLVSIVREFLEKNR